MKRKRRKAKLVPPRGPAQNLRPAGAHETKKTYNRKRLKAALEDYVEDGFAVCCGAFLRAARVSSASTTAPAIR